MGKQDFRGGCEGITPEEEQLGLRLCLEGQRVGCQKTGEGRASRAGPQGNAVGGPQGEGQFVPLSFFPDPDWPQLNPGGSETATSKMGEVRGRMGGGEILH